QPFLIAQHEKNERAEGERDKGKVMVLDAQRGIAKHPPDCKGQKAGGHERGKERHARGYEQRNRISTDPDKGTLRQRYLPGVAERQIEADGRNRENGPGRNQENAVGLEEKRR